MTDRNRLVLLRVLCFCLATTAAIKADSIVTACNADNTPGTAIDLNNAIAAGGRITFSCPPATVITFSQRHDVKLPTQIDGGGNVTLDARGNQMFNAGAAFTLTNLTIRNARPPSGSLGGVVTGTGPLNIANSHFIDNSAAISLSSSVSVDSSTFLNGTGTVISAQNLNVTNSTIRGTAISAFAGSAGAINIRKTDVIGGLTSTFSAPCRLNIANSSFSSTTATAIVSNCNTTISKTSFNGNHGQNGGALYLTAAAIGLVINGGSFTSNSASGNGGAIAFEPTTGNPRLLKIQNVTFDANSAANGGAIHLGSFIENNIQLLAKSLIFSNNSASSVGGAIAGTDAGLTLSRALFLGNRASKSGGALDFDPFHATSLTVANALFTGNSAPQGSVFHGSSINFVNVTIANSSDSAAISPFWRTPNLNSVDPWAFITFRNVAFWNNAQGACESTVFSRLFQDAGHNLQFPSAACPASIQVADPKFDAMFIPAIGGAADGTGDLSACLSSPVSAVDLFGKHRPQGKSCSIGAVEGDIEDAVLHSNPSYSNLPRTQTSKCKCETVVPKSCDTSDPNCQPPKTIVTVVSQVKP